MKKVTLLILIALIFLSSPTLAQSKMEEMGLRGPVKTVVEKVEKQAPTIYVFSRDGKIVSETVAAFTKNSFTRKYSALEQINSIEIVVDGVVKTDSYTEYDEEKKEYRIWAYDDWKKDKRLFGYGTLDDQGRTETFVFAMNNAFRVKTIYDADGNIGLSEYSDERGWVYSKEEYKYGKKNQLLKKKTFRRKSQEDSFELTQEDTYQYDQDGYLIRFESFLFRNGNEKEIKEEKVYSYIFFDSHGNWTKRFCYQDEVETLEEREISYYGEWFDFFEELRL